jgi:C4-dicarboxylate transporter
VHQRLLPLLAPGHLADATLLLTFLVRNSMPWAWSFPDALPAWAAPLAIAAVVLAFAIYVVLGIGRLFRAVADALRAFREMRDEWRKTTSRQDAPPELTPTPPPRQHSASNR